MLEQRASRRGFAETIDPDHPPSSPHTAAKRTHPRFDSNTRHILRQHPVTPCPRLTVEHGSGWHRYNSSGTPSARNGSIAASAGNHRTRRNQHHALRHATHQFQTSRAAFAIAIGNRIDLFFVARNKRQGLAATTNAGTVTVDRAHPRLGRFDRIARTPHIQPRDQLPKACRMFDRLMGRPRSPSPIESCVKMKIEPCPSSARLCGMRYASSRRT